jgi:EmrB/QacA subfamily drug resistance transporter
MQNLGIPDRGVLAGKTFANKTFADKNWVLALTSIASFMMVLDSQVVTTALSTIRADLNASLAVLQWTMNAYNLSFAVLLLTGSALGDRFGRRRLFMIGLAVFVIASAACAVATSAAWLIVARAVQGAGAALVTPLAMALLTAAAAKSERGKALGIFSGVNGLALILGPVIGGAIADGGGWRAIFWINLPIGLVVMPLARRCIPESFGTKARFDQVGVVLVSGAAFGAVWGLMRGNAVGWSSTEVTAALALGVVFTAAFIAWEARAPQAMVPLGFFRAPPFAAGIAASFMFYAAMYAVLFLLPQFLQTAQGYGPLDVGLRLLPWTATLFFIGPAAGAMVNRLGARPIVVVGLVVQAVGLAWLGLIATPALPYVYIAGPLVLAGIGVSAAMPAVQSAVLTAVAEPDIGKASGIFNMFRFLGGAAGIAIAVVVFGRFGSVASPSSFSAGFTPAIGACAALSMLGAFAAFWLPTRDRSLRPARAEAAE